MKEVKFTVPGTPVAKARARTFYDGKIGKYRSITPEKTVSYEAEIKFFYQHESDGEMFEKGCPLELEITARFEPPGSISNKRRRLMLSGQIRHTKKPDVDNLAKAVMDALNKVAWHDDSQVVSISVLKQYAECGGVDIVIRSIDC